MKVLRIVPGLWLSAQFRFYYYFKAKDRLSFSPRIVLESLPHYMIFNQVPSIQMADAANVLLVYCLKGREVASFSTSCQHSFINV